VHTQEMGSWKSVVYPAGPGARLGPHVLGQLVDGDTSVVVLKDLLPRGVFDTHQQILEAQLARASTTRYSNGALTTLGPYLARFLPDPARYFEEADETRALFKRIQFDLAERVRARLKEVLGLRSFETAREPDGRCYAECIVRIHADGVRNPLHNDNVMRDAASTPLLLARLKQQLSCVVCIQECDTGGELYHYRKQWHPEDEVYKIPGGLGYDEQVVRGHACNVFKPHTGDVYLLNPTYYHAIERVGGSNRLTLGFFIGLPGDGLDEAVIWS
jgi:hypothetical protein